MELEKVITKRQTVVSSNIKEVAFIKEINVDDIADPVPAMIVTFKPDNSYLYLGVTDETYEEMLESESVGSFVATNIKNKYKTLKRQPDGEWVEV